MHNPFADFGSIVYGESFVGREAEKRLFRQRIVEAAEPACIAVVGAPRIGKSSLAYDCLIHPRESLLERQLLAFRVNLPDFTNLAQLFRRMVRLVYDELEGRVSTYETLASLYNECLRDDQQWLDVQYSVQRFFRRVRRLGWRAVFIIDEFDSARTLFHNDPGAFQSLREMAYHPEWRVAFVTLSRRPLTEIEEQAKADISTFAGTFNDVYLRPFSLEELRVMLGRAEAVGITVDDALLEEVSGVTGGHPLLTAVLAFHMVGHWGAYGRTELSVPLRAASSEFVKYYGQLITIFSESGMLDKLLQIVFGPVLTATEVDVQQLMRYGLLKSGPDNFYTPFSSHFREYLRLIERTTDFWPLWRDTERLLRGFIARVMETRYQTEEWAGELEKTDAEIKKLFTRARYIQNEERDMFGTRASANLLDYTYPWDLHVIIRNNWPQFEPVLKHDPNYWQERFVLLDKVRNPMAHSREHSVEAHERQIAEGYCREIKHLLTGGAVNGLG